jgi:hypothetical protein
VLEPTSLKPQGGQSSRMYYERVRTLVRYEFRICSNIPDAGIVLDRLLAPLPEIRSSDGVATYTLWERRGDREPFTLSLDGGTIQRVESAGSMVDWLLIDITRKAIEQAEGYVSVHAGVVSTRGRAVLFPAAPDAGKTTTVAGLIRAGFSYLSDEVALLGLQDASVHAFPRPLVMDRRSLNALGGLRDELPRAYDGFRNHWYHVAPDDLRPSPTEPLAMPAYIVAPRFRKGMPTALRPMTRAETLFVLGENAFNLQRTGLEGLAILRGLAQRLPGFRLEIGDLSAAIDIVTDLLERGVDRTVAGAEG